MEDGDQTMIINGGAGGGQIEIRDGINLLMPPDAGTMISKKNMIRNNVEETKINFFDPNAFRRDEDEEEGQAGDAVDHQILEGKIDPGEWKKEMERVYQDLDNIEKDIELSRQRGGGPASRTPATTTSARCLAQSQKNSRTTWLSSASTSSESMTTTRNQLPS